MSVSDAINLALAVLTALGVIIALLTFRRVSGRPGATGSEPRTQNSPA